MRALAIIPAREGSKGVPGKNLRPLLGSPLIVYTIRTAQEARSIARTIISTDSKEIARISAEHGGEVVMRPPELATDESPTEDALIHVVETLEARGEPRPEYVVTLEPTSPLRSAGLVDACVELAVAERADAVISVAESRECFGRLNGSRFEYLDPRQPRRRQLREPLYRESSSVYVTRTEYLLAHRSVLAEPLYAVVAAEDEAIDLNGLVDFAVAEAILSRRLNEVR